MTYTVKNTRCLAAAACSISGHGSLLVAIPTTGLSKESLVQDTAVEAAHALLSAADHDALSIIKLACAAAALLESRTQAQRAAPTEPAGPGSDGPPPWLQHTAQLLRQALAVLAETGSLAAIAERVAASVCSAVLSLSALSATQQVNQPFTTLSCWCRRW